MSFLVLNAYWKLIYFDLYLARGSFSALYKKVRNYPLRKQRSEEHTSELQSQSNLVCRLLLEKKKKNKKISSEEQQEQIEDNSCIVHVKPVLPHEHITNNRQLHEDTEIMNMRAHRVDDGHTAT